MPLRIGPKRKACITKKHLVHFWGQRHFVSPAYVPTVLGDGRKLLAVQPLNTRPKYYLIRVDSSWSERNSDQPCVCDHIDEIYDVIEEWFGPHEWEDDHGRTRYSPWPSPNLDCGSSWWDATDMLKRA